MKNFRAESSFVGASGKTAGLRYGRMSGFGGVKVRMDAQAFGKMSMQTDRLTTAKASRVEPRNLRPMHYIV